MPHANVEIYVDDRKTKQIVHGDEDSHQFYSAFETVADMTNLEAPLSQEMFSSLVDLYYDVNICAIPIKDQKRNTS